MSIQSTNLYNINGKYYESYTQNSKTFSGNGIVALESPVPRSELIEIELDNDVIKVDGNFVIAWSKSLDFTVEKSTKSLVGSAISKEGFVNVYRGTGKLLLAPVCNNPIVTLSPLIPSNK